MTAIQSNKNSPLKLENGSKVAIIGGGPAGSFFSYFLLDLSERVGLDIQVDIYERKNFSSFGPAGCNHCGGIVSESLVQALAAEGINIPSKVVQRGINSYVLHTDVGSVRIDTPLQEKRIAAMHRGAGPHGSQEIKWSSFDGFLQKLTSGKGADIINDRVKDITFRQGKPELTTKGGKIAVYDLLVGTAGINNTLKAFENMGMGYKAPVATKTFICEFHLGHELVLKHFSSSMHVFLLNLPRLEFAALIPKGDYVSLALLGDDIDKELVQSFLNSPEVKACFPPEWDMSRDPPCKCYPKINVKGAVNPVADRVVMIGDCAITKLYKNGIGAAYITAKAAATTAVFHGISQNDFKKHYLPACREIVMDNFLGKLIFIFTSLLQKLSASKRAMLRVIAKEQKKESRRRHMSMVMWDTFTGSAPYKDIFMRTLNPFLQIRLVIETIAGLLPFKGDIALDESSAGIGDIGKVYSDGETIINQGDVGDCLYVIQSGKVEVIQVRDGKETFLTELGEGDFFGEMALFEQEVRSSTVKAIGDVRVLTVDKKTLLGRIQADPSMAFRIVQKMSSRIRELNDQLGRLQSDE